MKGLKLWKRRPYLVDKIVFTIVFVFFTVYALTLVYPFFWAFMSSLKSPNEYFENAFALPKDWLFSNYPKALSQLAANDVTFLEMTWNSIWYTGVGILVNISVLSLLSYTVAKYNFKMRPFITGLNMFLMLIPIMGSMPAAYRLYHTYGIVDSPIFVVLTTTGVFGANFLILTGYYRSLSWSYAEAAFIDGASDFTAYFKIMLPLATGPLSCMILTMFIARWNEYLTPIMYLESYPTLSSGLYTYRQISVERFGTYPVFFAGALVSMLPVLALYTAFHKTIMENMLGGGIKE